ncbi:integrase, catalytic region, zinc finger, CCHC-type containing protein [Tanacetum coccineum]
MWERIRRLMYGSEKNKHVIHSRLMNEFDKFDSKEGELLESVYERLSTLVNVMDRNDVRPIKVSINTKFLNSLQPEWSKYVTLTPSKANIVAKNHYPLALIAHSNAYSSQSHASSSHSHSPQPYYVTHPSSVVDSKEDYQRKLQRDADRYGYIKNLSDVEYDALYDDLLQFEPYVQASKAKRAAKNHDSLALIAHSNAYLSQSHASLSYSHSPQPNAWRQNKNQVANARNGQVQQIDESNQIVQRVPRTDSNPGRANVQCYNCNARGHYAHDYP